MHGASSTGKVFGNSAQMNCAGEEMNAIRLHGCRLLVVSCVVAASALSAATVSDVGLLSQGTTDSFDPATIEAIGDKVADWQLANLDDLSYIRNLRDEDTYRRGWQHAALYVGLMNWAALPGNEKYDRALREISEDNQWQLGRRLFHGDDHAVGQLYLHFYEQEKDSGMVAHIIQQFNQILVANPGDTLEFLGDPSPGVGWVCQLRWCWCDALFMSAADLDAAVAGDRRRAIPGVCRQGILGNARLSAGPRIQPVLSRQPVLHEA